MHIQQPNLITFTPLGPPPPGQHEVQGAIGIQSVPKKQRSPKRRKRSEWQLNQKQFEHNRSQEISHISPREHIFNIEEPSVSYLQLPTR